MEKIKKVISQYYFVLFVSIVILFAFILRYYYTNIGLPYLYYWDEPQIASTALNMIKTGDLNPRFFAYGTFMIYANVVVDILHYFSLMATTPEDINYLGSLNDIKINVDTGWKWSISHPSFYHANRVFSVLLATGTVFVTYLIGTILFNRYIGLIGAIFLALLPFHIMRSVWISADSPSAFFVLLVVLFSLLFIETKKESYLILSLVFAGIAITSKYNTALSIFIPLLSLVWVFITSKESIKTYMWFLIPTIPIIIFLIIMPYSIIELPRFLDHVGGEIRHYKVLGQGVDDSVKAGLPHLKIQLINFYHHLGFVNSIMVLLGIVGVFFRPLFIFTLIMPLLYISYMMGTKVSYHRNFIQVYPFIALLFASGFYTLYKILNRLKEQLPLLSKYNSAGIVAIVSLFFIAPQAYSSLSEAIVQKEARDSRTHAVYAINSIQGFSNIVIAKELRIHPQELKLLKLPYTIEPLLTISTQKSQEKTLYILPALISSSQWEKDKNKIYAMRKFIASLDKASILQTIQKNDTGDTRAYVGVTRLHYFSVTPTILFAKNLTQDKNR